LTQTLLELLIAEGRLPLTELASARLRAEEGLEPVICALLSAGAVDEGELVAALTQRLGWPLAAEERLLHASLSPALRERVPQTLARACLALPLALDLQRSTLTVAMGDPTEAGLVERLRRAADVAAVRPLVARASLLQRAVVACYAVAPDAPARPVVSASARWRGGQGPAEPAAAGPGGGVGAGARIGSRDASRDRARGASVAPSWGEGPLLEEALAAVGVLVAMLEERIDPQRARSRELARLTRAVLLELGGAPPLIARASLAAHLAGLDITLRHELGTAALPTVSEIFAVEPEGGAGGLGPVLRALGRQALAQPAAEEGPGAGAAPAMDLAVDAVASYLARIGDGAAPARVLAELRAAAADVAVIEGLARVAQRAESRPAGGAAASSSSEARGGPQQPTDSNPQIRESTSDDAGDADPPVLDL